jgi:hypothetical protein
MSDVEAAGTSAADRPPPLKRENSLEEIDGDTSLAEDATPGDPDDSLALEDPPLEDAPDAGGTDDLLEVTIAEAGPTISAASSSDDVARQPNTPEPSSDVFDLEPDEPEGPVEEFPADNTPDVIVSLVILPENFQHVLRVKAMTTGHDLKEKVVAELPFPYDALSLRYRDEDFPDDVALLDFGIKPGSQTELELVVTFATAEDESEAPEEERKTLPDFIDVLVPERGDEIPWKTVRVAIDASASQKPRYQGGYRDRRTGGTFLHAGIQTERQTPLTRKEKFTTETQTFELRTRKAQTQRESSTQMDRPDILLDHSRDISVRTGAYVTAEETLKLKETKAIVLQRFARGARDRRRRDILRRKRDAEMASAKERLELTAREELLARQLDIERRIRPMTDADFKLLTREFDSWRTREISKIDALYPKPVEAAAEESVSLNERERRRKLGAELYGTANLAVSASRDARSASVARETRKRAMTELLAKETKMLLAVERLRKRAEGLHASRRVASALEDMSASKVWEKKDGAVVVVDTTHVIRARELRALYEALALNCSVGERLELLRHLKWTAKEFTAKLTEELCELIDRESDLLERGRDAKMMIGLRKRLSNLFLRFIETPEFNPEAARYSAAALARAAMERDRETERVAREARVRASRESRGACAYA